MYINPIYSLYDISGIPYLLPHGQGIADHRHGIQINEAGVFLWNILQKTTDRQKLLAAFYRHYDAGPQDYAQLEQDLNDFLNHLFALGILLREKPSIPANDTQPVPLQQSVRSEAPPSSDSCLLQIGPLVLQLIADPDAISSEFLPFQTTQNIPADLTIELNAGVPDIQYADAALLIRHEQLLIYETEESYLLKFPQAPQLSFALLNKDGSYASVYYTQPYTEAFASDLFHAVRILFLYTAQLHGCYALHSASVYYRGKAWLFSGHSGMGKTTHTNLWQSLYHVKMLNGDLNLISFLDNDPVIYGMPWCGTSQIADTETYSLGGIILLDRSSRDECLPLLLNEQILLCTQRLISPTWTANLFQRNLDFISSLVNHISVCMLKCTKNPSAAAAAKQWIDKI